MDKKSGELHGAHSRLQTATFPFEGGRRGSIIDVWSKTADTEVPAGERKTKEVVSDVA